MKKQGTERVDTKKYNSISALIRLIHWMCTTNKAIIQRQTTGVSPDTGTTGIIMFEPSELNHISREKHQPIVLPTKQTPVRLTASTSTVNKSHLHPLMKNRQPTLTESPDLFNLMFFPPHWTKLLWQISLNFKIFFHEITLSNAAFHLTHYSYHHLMCGAPLFLVLLRDHVWD